MPTEGGAVYEQIIAWVALVVFAPVYLPAYYVSYPKDYLLLAAEYVEIWTFGIPYWTSSYLAEVFASYQSLLGLYLISLIQGAISG